MATTLTTSYKKISTISLTYGEIRTYAKYTSQSTTNNNTTYKIKSTYYVNSGVTQVHFSSATAKLDGTTKSYGDTYMYTGETTIQELTRTLNHNNDGSSPNKNIATEWSATFGGSGNTSATIKMPKINRYATITSAPNFTDEQNPTITYSNPAGNSVSSLQVCIASLDGMTTYAGYRDVSKTGSSYTFNLTEAERNNLRAATPNSNTFSVKFYVKTVINGTTYRETSTKTLTIVNANPTETTTFLETNQDVIDLLGDSSADTIIQNVSQVKLTSSPTAYKSATISKVQLKNGTTTITDTSSPYETTLTPTSTTFQTIVTDSRGNTVTNTYTKTMLNYIPGDITSYSFKRVNPTSSDILLNAEIRYKQATFNGHVNSPTIQWKIGEQGTLNTLSSEDYTIDTENDLITISNLLLSNVLPYTDQANFYLYAKDLLTEDAENMFVSKGIPTFEAGEHDFQVNGNLYIATQNRTNITEIRNLIYPIGSIYMSVNNTNPSTLFGGTWVQLQNRFLLGAGSSYTAGDTGGSATHKLTIDEMPSHSHGLKNDKTGGSGSAKWVINSSASSGTGVITNTGGNQAHNNMPPYLVVYMWKRTA